MDKKEVAQKSKSHDFLKNVFDWLTNVIASADNSMVIFAVVILPIIVPLVPAWITSRNLNQYMEFEHPIDYIGGLTIELLGFSAAILLIKSLTEWVESMNGKTFWKMAINALAYIFYLVAVVSVNVIMDLSQGRSSDYVWVIALFCLLSVPSGLLSATRIVDNQHRQEDANKAKDLAEQQALERKENQEFLLRKIALKNGINIFNPEQQTLSTGDEKYPTRNKSVVVPERGSSKKSDWRLLTPNEKREVIEQLSVAEIMDAYGVSDSTAYAWKSKKL